MDGGCWLANSMLSPVWRSGPTWSSSENGIMSIASSRPGCFSILKTNREPQTIFEEAPICCQRQPDIEETPSQYCDLEPSVQWSNAVCWFQDRFHVYFDGSTLVVPYQLEVLDPGRIHTGHPKTWGLWRWDLVNSSIGDILVCLSCRWFQIYTAWSTAKGQTSTLTACDQWMAKCSIMAQAMSKMLCRFLSA